MGEGKMERSVLVKVVGEALAEQMLQGEERRVTTPGGRFQVRWDENWCASALGQVAFFAEFLDVSGLFERWAESCAMSWGPGFYRSLTGSGVTPTSRHCGVTQWHRRYWG